MNNNGDLMNNISRICSSSRGAVSSADYLYIVLPAFILKWAELQEKENGFAAYKEIYAPARLSVTYGTADRASDVMEYLFSIENECSSRVYGGYIRELSRYLEMLPVKDFADILGNVSKMEITSSDEIYAFAKVFLLLGFKGYGKSPYSLSCTGTRQIEKIALGDVSDSNTVFDGFAGTGVSAFDSTKGHGVYTFNELSAHMACITEMMCILKGINAKIYVTDSFFNDNNERLYDVITSEPPFALKGLEYRDLNLPYYDSDMDNMCLKYLASKLNSTGKGIVLCPAGILFRGGRSMDGRIELCNSYIETVIQLPSGAVTGTQVQTAIIVLNKQRRGNDILFVDASTMLKTFERNKVDLVLGSDNEDLLKGILTNRKDVDGISKVVAIEDIAKKEYSLVVTQYIENDSDKVQRVDIEPLLINDKRLKERLYDIDEELDKLRS